MIAAIVPSKPRDASKTRLGQLLDHEERRLLHDRLLARTLTILSDSPDIGMVYLVGGDPIDSRWNGQVVQLADPGIGLNGGIAAGLAACAADGWPAALVVPIDLPLLDERAIECLVQYLSSVPEGDALVIVPDRHGDGTNALLVRPPDLIRPEYGRESFRRHLQQARATRTIVADIEQLYLDLDYPEDLALLPPEVRDVLIAPNGAGTPIRIPTLATSRRSS